MKVINFQRYVAFFSVVLFISKLVAWYLTNSVMVLTDALEGIVNMVTGFLGWYCLILAEKPRDTNHPFGHGKVQYLSSAVEGTLILFSALVVIWEATEQLILKDYKLQKLDIGLVIVVCAGLVNYALGKIAEITGKKQKSIILESAGKHLITDGYSSIAIIIGLALLLLVQSIPQTKNQFLWLDSVVALIFAVVILFTGYRVLRKSIAGIMDEVDSVQLEEVVKLLQNERKPQWVDMHNLRVIQYGNTMHVDAHITLPWFLNVEQAEKEIGGIENLISNYHGSQVEIFLHVDSCLPIQCKICKLDRCAHRSFEFLEQLSWNTKNLWENEKHSLE